MSTSDADREKTREFESLAFRHMDALYSTALRLTKNQLDAEDLLQDTYLRAFRFYDKFSPGTNFKAWIFKILTNTFINRYRKKLREPQKIEFEKIEFSYSEDLNHKDEAKYQANVDYEVYNEIFDDKIKEALDRLSEDFRMVVILCDIHGFSYKEIADMIGIPIGTVMSRLSRGRKQLQKYLEEYAIREGYIKRKME
ncbi:MAG: sigma-70 family RNA polymerase sigma factor [Calditrichaeota bacterium]|nr:MAG: sigma-70 family RNA polymerase sigma factor [Calditrichota bacterium]